MLNHMIFGKCTQQIMSVTHSTQAETQIWEVQMHVCQTISTNGDEDPQFLDTEISH